MADTKETRSAPIGIRVTPSLKAALEQAAADDHRPMASLIEKVLADWLRERGYLKRAKSK